MAVKVKTEFRFPPQDIAYIPSIQKSEWQNINCLSAYNYKSTPFC